MKDIVPGQLDELQDIGFFIAGRWTIFFISLVIFTISFGCCIIYFIVFGDICKSLVSTFVYDGNKDNLLSSGRFVYVLTLAAILLILIVRKQIKELKIASIFLFLGVMAFLVIFIYQLMVEGLKFNHDHNSNGYFNHKFDLNFVKSCSILLIAFGFQINLFPILRSLKTQTNQEAMKSIHLALIATTLIYISVAILGIVSFGHLVKEDILVNIGEEGGKWEQYVL
jgi:amino acid permease